MRIYVNGSEENDTTVTNPGSTSTSDIRNFGNRSGKSMDTRIASVMQFNRVLTADEISQLYTLMSNKQIKPFVQGVKD